VDVEGFYLRHDICPSDAKAIILESIKAFKYIFPGLKVVYVKFNGVKDNTKDGDETIRQKEIRNKKLWDDAKVGNFVVHDDAFLVDLNIFDACNT